MKHRAILKNDNKSSSGFVSVADGRADEIVMYCAKCGRPFVVSSDSAVDRCICGTLKNEYTK